MRNLEHYEEKRNEILDQIINLRQEYNSCFPVNKGETSPFRMRGANEILKYAKTQDPLPKIPKRYLVDLSANIPIHMKINSFIGLLEKTYDISKQEREFLYSIEKDYAI